MNKNTHPLLKAALAILAIAFLGSGLFTLSYYVNWGLGSQSERTETLIEFRVVPKSSSTAVISVAGNPTAYKHDKPEHCLLSFAIDGERLSYEAPTATCSRVEIGNEMTLTIDRARFTNDRWIVGVDGV